MKAKLTSLALLMITFCGCATTQRITTVPAARQAIMTAARRELGKLDSLVAIEIGSSGKAADATFVRMSKSFGPSHMAKQIAQIMGSFSGQERQLMLFGPNSTKTVQVSIDALNLCSGQEMKNVTFVFCGKAGDFSILKEKTAAFSGSIRFVKQP